MYKQHKLCLPCNSPSSHVSDTVRLTKRWTIIVVNFQHRHLKAKRLHQRSRMRWPYDSWCMLVWNSAVVYIECLSSRQTHRTGCNIRLRNIAIRLSAIHATYHPATASRESFSLQFWFRKPLPHWHHLHSDCQSNRLAIN